MDDLGLVKAVDRLDPEHRAVCIDKGNHRFSGRSSSARAKYAGAVRAHRLSRYKALIFSTMSLGKSARLPLTTSAFFTHSWSVCAEQQILAAIEETAAHRNVCSASVLPPCARHGHAF